MQSNTSRGLRAGLLAATAVLSACAGLGTRPAETSAPVMDWVQAEQALRAERWAQAQPPLARLLRQDLQNGQLQFLHALSEELQARAGDRSRLEFAAVGYESALRFAPGLYWAMLQLGFVELERGRYAAAQARFAEAAMDQPRRWEAFYGLGVASYYRRDLALMQLAADRSLALSPDQPQSRQLVAYARAAQGDPSARALLAAAAAGAAQDPQLRHAAYRIEEWLDAPTQMVAPDSSLTQAVDEPEPDVTGDPSQVVIEVTILLNSVLDQANRGVNLFDGLRVLYGYSNTLTQTIGSLGRESTRTITSQISSPQLDYNLNIFNDSGQYYGVVARPSITAHLGRESQFFAGRTLNVEVSGVNLGALQPIDVGVQLKVTPESIGKDRVSVQLVAERSFLSQEQIGTFERSLTTFRQSVSATADIAFGQTLVLSALSEQVSDKSFSKVPLVGDVPVANWFTRRSTDARRQESLLILVTPKLPLTMSTPDLPERRERAVKQLLDVWNQRIDAQADVPAVLRRLQRMRWLRQPEVGDLPVQLPQSAQWRHAAIEEALALAQR